MKFNSKVKINKKLLIALICLLVIMLVGIAGFKTVSYMNQTANTGMQKQFNEITEEDYETQSDNVKFMAYFLSGENKVDGTSNRVGYNDTMYFDLSVTGGSLENAIINIDSQNFYLETNLMSDSVISQNYISKNTKEIVLNNLSGDVNKTFTGFVNSGDYEFTTSNTEAIGSDISNYNKVSTITFTADYIASDGTRTSISKEIPLTVNWYGEVNCEIPEEVYGRDNLVQNYRLSDYLDTENDEMTLEFNIATQETNNEVLINKSYVEGIVPLINDVEPTNVVVEGENVQYTYDAETRKFTASREAVLNENTITEEAYSGTYAQNEINYRYNEYTVKVTYPIDAYLTDDDEYINIDIPVTAHYEGFNGEKSNDITENVNVSYSNLDNEETGFDVSVGRHVIYPEERQVVSKDNVLLGYRYYDVDPSNIESTYYTRWNIVTNPEETAEGVVLTDNNAEDKFITEDEQEIDNNGYILNKGIAFSNPISALGRDGWISVYNDETDELIHTFTVDDWADYDTLNPYEYEQDVRYIRIETSEVNENSFVMIYNIKEFDIEKIMEDFTEEEIKNVKYIQTSFNGEMSVSGEPVNYTNTARANFEEEISVVNFDVSEGDISTQGSNNLQIEISPNMTQYNTSRWENGEFLIKFPSDIISVDINDIRTNNNNMSIYDYYQYKEDGYIFIKIQMKENEFSNYQLLLDCTIATNPTLETKTSEIELYAYNKENNLFYETEFSEDIYDINNNADTAELIGKKTDNINIVRPNTLLTNQSTSNASSSNETIYAPLTAMVENEDRTVTVDINLENNDDEAITDITILGTIPFEENKYQLTGEDLGSTYSAELTQDGIKLPEELARRAQVYYSENATVTEDLDDEQNGWTLTLDDYSHVKHFLIVFNSYDIEIDEELTISYDIKIPESIQYNEVSYSTHTVYYSEHNNGEITRKKVESNKLGFNIARTFDFELTKYSRQDNNPVEGVTFRITEVSDRRNSTILVTGADGKVNISDLLLEKTYEVEEIGVPDEYIIDDNIITFRAYEENGEIRLDIDGQFEEDPIIDQDTATVSATLYNEIKYDLNITNLNTDGEGIVSTFTLEGRGETINSTTNREGHLVFEGLYPGEEYVLRQAYSKGYYIEDESEIIFTVSRGENGLEIVSDDSGVLSLEEQADSIKPVLNVNITNEKIPTYSLKVNLYEDDTSILLEGAEYLITGGGKEQGETYTTNETGSFVINDLYTYIDGKNETAEYTLVQTSPATGYALNSNPIRFVVSKNQDTQELTLTVSSGEIREDYTIDGNTVYISLDARKLFDITTVDSVTADLLPGTKLAIKELAIIDDVEVEIDPRDENGNILGTEEVIDGVTYRVFTTSDEGIIEENLRDGIYKIVVVGVPEGYHLEENEEDRTYYVGIGTTRGATVDAEFREPLVLTSTGSTEPSDYYVAGREDGMGLFYHTGNLALINEENQVLHEISSDVVYQIIDTDEGFVVLEDDRIVEYNDNLEEIASYNLTSGMRKFAATADGGFVVVGDFSGNKTVSGNMTASGSSISIDSVKTGSWIFQQNTVDIFVMKVNSDGKVENLTNVGGTSTDRATYVTVDLDGDFIVTSHIESGSISGDMMSDGNSESGNFDDNYFVMDSETMKITQIVSVGTSRGNVEETEGNVHRAFAGNDGGVYYVGQMSGTITFNSSQTESGETITVTSTGDTDAYAVKFNSEGKVVWAMAVGGTNTDHIYSAEYTPDGELLIGGDSQGGAITVDGSKTSSGISIETEPIGDNASTWRGIVIKIDDSGRVVWANEFGYAANEGCYAFAGFTGNSYVICGFNDNDNNVNNGRSDVYIRVDEAESRSEISEVEGLEIPIDIEKYDITTSVNGEGGSITGQDADVLETVEHGKNSTQTITITPDEGYEVLSVIINGEKVDFTPDENGVVTLPLFENVTKDINVVAEFSNNTSKIIVHHYLLGTEDTRVAEDDVLVGIVGTEYTTGPVIGLVGYELATDDDGSFIIDGNPSGTYGDYDQEVTYYYVEKAVRVTVNHFIEGTNTSLSDTIVKEYTRGQTYTTTAATDIPEEYELVRMPSNATGVIDESEVVVTYYYKLKPTYEYRIEYYYDGVIDEALTETGEAIEGKEVNTYTDNLKEGYVFDREENYPLIVSTNEEDNVIKIYYKAREDLSYRIEYYYDGVINNDETINVDNVKFGTVVSEFTDKAIEGYQFSSVSNYPLTVGVKEEDNVIRVYYTIRTDLYYTVNYLEQGTDIEIIESKEVGSNTYNSEITEYPVEIPGYNKVSEEGQTITIGVNEKENVINFYYTKRDDLSYTVNYLEQGTNEEIVASKVVENQTYQDVITENAIDIPGYYPVEPTEATITIDVENNVINFYYEKRTDIPYRVEYYYDEVIDSSLTENYTATFEEEINEYEDKVKDAYKLDRVENLPLTISAQEEQNVIRVYYVRKDAEIIENSVQKTATDKITVEDGRIDYKVTYIASLEEFIGKATITIVDTLPYRIDLSNSDIANGQYDEEAKTITWTENVEDINTYTNPETGNISITKEFYVVYEDIDYSNTNIVNKVNANISLDTTGQNENTAEAEATTVTEFTKDVTVRKEWDHTNNIYEIPDEVNIQVKDGDDVVREQVINESNEVQENVWEYTFEDLTKYDEEGQEINYTVDETEVESGDLAYYDKEIEGYTIKNTYAGPIISAEKTVSGLREDGYTRTNDTLTYTITVRNDGDRAKDVVVTDTIPEGMKFVEGSIRVDDEVRSELTEDNLESGITVNVDGNSTATVSFEATVTYVIEDSLTHEYSIYNTAVVDGEETNTVEVKVLGPDIEISKEADRINESEVTAGDLIKYTIRILNNGGYGKISVSDIAPTGTTLEGNDITNDYFIGEDEELELEFTVRVNNLNNGDVISNIATVDGKETNEVIFNYVEPEIDEDNISKTATTENKLEYVVEGEKITYTISVENTGLLEKDVVIIDEIPEGTSLVEGSIKVNDEETEYTESDIETGITVNVDKQSITTVSFEVTVDKLAEGLLTKEIRNKATVDGMETNETLNVVNKADLKFTKSAEPESGAEVKLDDKITYTITLDNSEGTAPTTANVVDGAPEGTSFVEGSIVVEGSDEEFDLDDLRSGIEVELAAGETKTIEFTVKVNDLNNGDKISNTATVNDVSTNEVEHTYVEPIISGTKSLETENELDYVVEGENITYTITVTNDGDLGKEVNVRDQIPEGTNLVEGSIRVSNSEAQYGENELESGILVNVDRNSTETVTFVVTVDELGEDVFERTIINTAYVDEEPTNEETIEVHKPNLEFTKTADPQEGAEVKIDDEITYTITLDNSKGTAPITTVVTDEIPEGTSFVDESIVIGNEARNELTEEELSSGINVDLGPGEVKNLEFKVKVNDLDNGDKITNTATVNDEETNPVEHTYVEAIIGESKSMETENGLDYVVEGENITYTITVTNDGDLGKNVNVRDEIPEGTSLVEGSIRVSNSETQYEENELETGITVNVDKQSITTVSFVVTVDELEGDLLTKEISNIAYVDEEPTNEEIVEVHKPHLEFTKIANPEEGTEIKLDDEITYSITLDNSIGTAPTTAIVSDEVPTGTTFVEGRVVGNDEGTEREYTQEELSDGLTIDIEAGETKKVELTVKVTDMDNGDIISNIGYVNGEETNEVEHTYVEAIISQTKEATTENNLSYVVEGEKITYTITVTNDGDLGKEVVVVDEIPEGTSLVDGSIRVNNSETEYTETNLETGIQVNVARNSKTTVSFEVTVDELTNGLLTKEIRNTATVDGNSTNTTLNVVNKADLKFTKSAYPESGAEVKLNDEITYTITLDNSEGTAPTTANVVDDAPEGTSFVDGSIVLDGSDEEFDLDDLRSGIEVELEAGETRTIEFTVRVLDLDNGDTITNTATVNDVSTNEVEHTYVEPVISSNKSSVTENNLSYVVEGEKITYTITITNDGDLGKEVVVVDEIPEGTSLVDGSIKVDNEETEYTESDLESGISVNVARNSNSTVSFEVTVDELTNGLLTKELRNTAYVDGEPTNTTLNVVNKSDVKYSKTAYPESGAEVKLDDIITYTIDIDNTTGTAPTTVTVVDDAPEGTSFVEGSIVVDTVSRAEYTLDDLRNGIDVYVKAGEHKTLEFKVKVLDLDNGDKITNTATVDGVSTNLVEHTYIEPIISENKSMETENGLDYVVEGENITYTITVTNDGNLGKNVVVVDEIPEGTSLVEGSIKVNDEETEYTESELETGITVNVDKQSITTVSFVVTVDELEGDLLTKEISNIAYVDEEPTNEEIVEVHKPHLEFTKIANPEEGTEIKLDDEITYSITLDNSIGTAPTTAIVSDEVPTGTTFVEGRVVGNDEGTEREYTQEELSDGLTIDIEAGETKKVELTVKVTDMDNGDIISNIGYVNGEETNEVEHTYVEAIISQTKEASTENNLSYVVEGEKITYTITVTNDGDLGKDVVVIDEIPEGTSLVEGSIRVNNSETEYTETNLESGISVNVARNSETIVSFEVTVDELTEGLLTKEIRNTATVDGNSTNTTLNVVNKADLKFTKTAYPESGAEVKLDDEITYTITLDNSEGTAPEIAIVKDTIPTGTVFVDNSIVVDAVEDKVFTEEDLLNGIQVYLGAGDVKTLEFTVRVLDLDNGDKISNIATVNDVSTNSVEHTYVEPIINGNKTATTDFGREYVVNGEKITYTITATNEGDLAKDVIVIDKIPEGTTFVEGSIRVNNEETEYTESNLESGITVNVDRNSITTVTFDVIVNETGTEIINKANVDGKETSDVKYPVLSFEKTSEIESKEEGLEEGVVTAGDKIIYSITLNNLGEEEINDIEIKDIVPDGTRLEQVNNQGDVTNRDITWKIANISENSSVTVSFEVIVDYDIVDTKEIRNVATVNGVKTNSDVIEYQKPEAQIIGSFEKDGQDMIVSTEEQISYTLNYEGRIRDFVGEGMLTIVDYLPYRIDTNHSYIDGGIYDDENRTITWEIELGEIDTYLNNGDKLIDINKNITLKYVYDDEEHLTGEIGNRSVATVELTQQDPNNPEQEIVIASNELEDTHSVNAKVPARVVVHHYIYDESLGGYTDVRLAADEIITGIIGDEYETEKSSDIRADYECIDEAPDGYIGTMTKSDIEVNYYYELKKAEISSIISKEAEANGTIQVEGEEGTYTLPVLTDEDGIVRYHISYRVGVKEYIGKVKVVITDYLPAEIDLDKSDLAGGTYNANDKTITWEEEIDVDTFNQGSMYDETIEKDISVVYVDQDVTQNLTNTVVGKMEIYYPEEHSSNQGEIRLEEEQTASAEVAQDYRVSRTVTKVWDDNDDTKGRRPDSVTIRLTADERTEYDGQELESVVLSDLNGWTYTFENLPKYTEQGREIMYSVIEEETVAGDLEYYESPVIEEFGDNIRVTNSYKLMETDLQSSIEKVGTSAVVTSRDEVTYDILYNATVENYIGEALVTIVDYLPYHIDENLSDLDGGIYDEEAQTITWTVRIDHINTFIDGNYEVNEGREIKVVYSDLDATQDIMINRVSGKIDLYETEQTNTVEGSFESSIQIPGKVIVSYVDRTSGEQIAKQEEITGMAGDSYTTELKDIYGYTYIENSGNTEGEMTEEDIHVTYYYDRTEAGNVTVTYIDEDTGEEIADRVVINGYIADEYTTEQKDIPNYDFVRVEGQTEGELVAEEQQVVYVYKKIPARVIVRYLEKDDTPDDDTDNVVLADEEIIDGYSGDEYITTRKEVTYYRPAEPEPENAIGTMTREDIYVTYYYERISSGTVTAIYVDVDTGEEISYVDEETGENMTYREELQGYCGLEYETSSKDIPYYTYLAERAPENSSGIYSEEDVLITYYYQKKPFNIGIDKNLTRIELNGTEQRVDDGKINKVEIPVSRVNDSTLEVSYSIVVTNTGEIEGTADVIESLPEYFKVIDGTSSEWEETEDGLKATVELQAGEQKELQVVLRWERGANHFGSLNNTVELENVINPANYQETTLEDNTSTSELVVSVKSGENRSMLIITMVIGLLSITAGTVAYIRKKTEMGQWGQRK